MSSFAYICRDCNYVLGEAGALSECPVCGSRRLSVCPEAGGTGGTSLFQEAAREFDMALDNGDLKTAKRLLGELSSFGHDASTKFSALVLEWEKAFVKENEPTLQALCKKDAFEEARSLLAKWESIGISTETHKKRIQDCETRVFRRIFDSLPMMSGLSAEASHSGSAKVNLSWNDVLHGREGKYSIARKVGLGRFAVFSDGEKLLDTMDSVIKDENVPLGVPVTYAVAACFKEQVNGKTMSLLPNVLCTAPIEGFHCTEAAGNDSFGLVSLSWQNPPWNAAAEVEMRLVREDGKTWGVSGRESFDDGDVRAGETHVYRLETTVGGKRLDPVECSVTVARVEEPPKIEGASVFLQGGRPRLKIPDWPDGVSEIEISRPGLAPHGLSREEYNKSGFFFHSPDEAATATVRAVRRFCGKHVVRGPASRIASPEESILYVSVESRKRSFWSREYGLRAEVDDGSALPPLVVTVERPDGRADAFRIPAGAVAPGEFFPFPPEWTAGRGDWVDVKSEEASGRSVRFRTSKVIG